MATRSERAAAVAGILVAVGSLGVLLYKAAGPLLSEHDPWLIGAVAAGVVILFAGAVVVSARLRRRQMARRIKRR